MTAQWHSIANVGKMLFRLLTCMSASNVIVLYQWYLYNGIVILVDLYGHIL